MEEIINRIKKSGGGVKRTLYKRSIYQISLKGGDLVC